MTPAEILNHGMQFHRAGRRPEAEAAYRQVLAQQPEQPDALHALGILAHESGKSQMAIDLLSRAVISRPQSSDFLCDFGLALASSGNLPEALGAYEQALRLNPASVDALNRTGIVQMQIGRYTAAVQSFQKSADLRPGDFDSISNLATALMAAGRLPEALEFQKKAVAINPGNAVAWNNQGLILGRLHLHQQSADSFDKALELAPAQTPILKLLADARFDSGEVKKTLDAIDRLMQADPRDPAAMSQRLCTLHFNSDPDARQIHAEHGRWNLLHARAIRKQTTAPDNDRNPDRILRIGYVCPDPRKHGVEYFLRAILSQHNPDAVDIYFYCDLPGAGDIALSIRELVPHCRNLDGLSDIAAAQVIRNDQIDILIDLAGHSENNRLLLFARRPAPMQAAYFGYPDTTGLTEIQWRITDAHIDPPGSEHYYTEKLFRLPDTSLCIAPSDKAPEVGPLPADSNGHITFGSFNRLAKLNDKLIASWAKILKEVPDSRLLLQTPALSDPLSQDRLAGLFASAGIERHRLTFQGFEANIAEHLKIHNLVDIALDGYPSGRATTAEALWMGVPVVTITGPISATRFGDGILRAAGLDALIAKSFADQANIAIHSAGDLSKLRELRSSLRDKLRHSVLMNASAFTANLEAIYRQMWQAGAAK